MNKSKIFLSYAWGGESEKIVNELDQSFQKKDIILIRDKRDLGFKGEITQFMNQIGAGSAVVVVISDKYLKSPYCMYELLEIYRNLKFSERIFPIVLGDANIFEPIPRLQYLKFWQEKKNELDNAIKEFGTDAITVIGDDYKTYKRVFDNFGEVVNILKDINSLTPEMHRSDNFKTLIEAVLLKVSETNDALKSSEKQKIVKNENNTTGSGNIVIQGVDANGNININVGSSNDSNSSENFEKKDNSALSDITNRRKQSILKRLDSNFALLDEYENKLMLEADPRDKMRYEKEIERINQQIEKLENDLRKMDNA